MHSVNRGKYHAYISQKCVLPSGVQPAILIEANGKIQRIVRNARETQIQRILKEYPDLTVDDFGTSVLMPGIVDSHVHVNEPGREEWEGFQTATRAAAAGGVTTIADMPLNSFPPTTTIKNLKLKAKVAVEKVFVDVAFWGGVIPGNQGELRRMIDAGVVGFKCFLCPSGVQEFPLVKEYDVEKALLELKSTKSVLAFHAEYKETGVSRMREGNPALYETFLRSRPVGMEKCAVEMICRWCKKYNVRCHIVHVSAAEVLELVKSAKSVDAPLTAETCHHYLTLCAEEIPEGATEFKCCPPIRNKANQDKLWNGIMTEIIDMVVSDHSPCVSELKIRGDFLKAWGGISSLQFGLPLFWTVAKTKGLGLMEISTLLSARPAKLCGIDDRKGSLIEGMDADFVIWNPEENLLIRKDGIFHRNKLTPYENKTVCGKVIATVLRGNYIYRDGKFCDTPMGNLYYIKFITLRSCCIITCGKIRKEGIVAKVKLWCLRTETNPVLVNATLIFMAWMC
ncbi:hypothetical protein KM043_017342 [Ampulex compressa]|nr:hypothetical protein KM043_017342 [Ampulex compressa]